MTLAGPWRSPPPRPYPSHPWGLRTQTPRGRFVGCGRRGRRHRVGPPRPVGLLARFPRSFRGASDHVPPTRALPRDSGRGDEPSPGHLAATTPPASSGARRVVPVHCDSWLHFTESREDLVAAFAEAGPADLLT
ncbi:hypothetical protein SGFS_083450 [Streptomyces graminofaciens]|uniref:Uncharacterized protein n=1 Tax=Streptomyces graminofaciens TaxID=68212 RepID=A0ABM7FL66_9ACTN|nr:hypothetical protein SGFS_083450 [Streptomyces graminofaciens]